MALRLLFTYHKCCHDYKIFFHCCILYIFADYYLHIIDSKRMGRRAGFKRVFGLSLKRDRTTRYWLQHAIFNLHHPLLKQYTIKKIHAFNILHHTFKPTVYPDHT